MHGTTLADPPEMDTLEDPSGESPLLTSREFQALARISASKFWTLKKAGLFRGLESPIPNRWSRAKVMQWLEGVR